MKLNAIGNTDLMSKSVRSPTSGIPRKVVTRSLLGLKTRTWLAFSTCVMPSFKMAELDASVAEPRYKKERSFDIFAPAISAAADGGLLLWLLDFDLFGASGGVFNC